MNVEPVDAPDIYLLVGQSNMIGFSGDATKQAFEGGPDEPHPRILQLNVTENLDFDTVNKSAIFTEAEDFTGFDTNVISNNPVVQAEDPLHLPLDPTNTSGKGNELCKSSVAPYQPEYRFSTCSVVRFRLLQKRPRAIGTMECTAKSRR